MYWVQVSLAEVMTFTGQWSLNCGLRAETSGQELVCVALDRGLSLVED